MKYVDKPWANSRLEHTYVVHNGKIVQYLYLNDRERVKIRDENGQRTVDFDDIQLNPPRIGFINLHFGAGYFSRVPLRRDYRQGFRRTSVKVDWVPSETWDPQRNFVEDDFFKLNPFLKGEYPSLDFCTELVQDKFSCRAFSYDFALSESGGVFYKGNTKVGNLDKKTNGVRLSKKFDYLRERLDEILMEKS